MYRSINNGSYMTFGSFCDNDGHLANSRCIGNYDFPDCIKKKGKIIEEDFDEKVEEKVEDKIEKETVRDIKIDISEFSNISLCIQNKEGVNQKVKLVLIL